MTKTSIPLEVDSSIMERQMRIVQAEPGEEELSRLLANVDPYPSKLVRPKPAFCVKARCPNGEKVFVNVCTTDAIPAPPEVTSSQLMGILASDCPDQYRVPMSLGEGRKERDKAGEPATAYDVAINPTFADKLEQDELFRNFFLTVVFEGLQDKYQLDLNVDKYVVLKNRKSVGTLQTHRIQVRNPLQPNPLVSEVKDSLVTPIEEVAAPPLPHRLRREPPEGKVEYLLAEFRVPAQVPLGELRLEVGEDRLLLESQGAFRQMDLFLPLNVRRDLAEARLDRNSDILSVKLPLAA